MVCSSKQVSHIAELRTRRLKARDAPIESCKGNITGEAILSALRHLAAGEFPKQCRPNVQPLGRKQVPGISLGLVVVVGHVRVSRGTQLLPRLTRMLCKYLRQHDTDFSFTSIQVNHSFSSRPHVDPHNLGPSLIHALGNFSGGELWVHDPDVGVGEEGEIHECAGDVVSANGILNYQKGQSYVGRALDVHRWQNFNGRRLHYTKTWEGTDRFSMIFYSLDRHAAASEGDRQMLQGLGFSLPTIVPRGSLMAEKVAKTSYLCATCGQSFPSSTRLHRHMVKHKTAEFVCTFDGCGKTFKREEHLKRHSWVHTSEKPHRCTEPGCGRSFSSTYGLRRHRATHDLKSASC